MILDPAFARALTDAGYMPVAEFVRHCTCDDAIARIDLACPVHAMKPFSQHESNRFPYDTANDARVRGGASVQISHHKDASA